MIYDKGILDKCSMLMVNRFLEEKDIQFQLNGVSNKEELFLLQCKTSVEVFNSINCLEVIDNGAGFLIGYNTKDLPEEKLISILTKVSQNVIDRIDKNDLFIAQKNVALLEEIAVFNWYKKYCKNIPVYNISVIAIDKELKGTGAFRRLISPVIQKYENVMPIVLQTYNKGNVAIYEHFGFNVIEKHSSDKLDLCCYNMMKH